MTFPLDLPFGIANGISADGNELQANLDAISSTINNDLLPKAGGSLTGNLLLNANPTAALGAAPKQYVDAHKPTSKFVRTTDFTLNTGTPVTGPMAFESETNDIGWWPGSGEYFTVPATGVYAICLEMDLNKVIADGSTYSLIGGLRNVGATYRMISLAPAASGAPLGGESDLSAFRYSTGGVFYLRAGEVFHVDYSFNPIGGVRTITIEEVTLAITQLAVI